MPVREESRNHPDVRDENLPNLLIIDGLWGSGKSLIAPILCRLSGIYPFRISGTIDQVAALYSLGVLGKDVARILISGLIASNFTANITSRSINLRPRDDSFYFRAGGKLRDVLRNYGESGSLSDFRDKVIAGYWHTEMTHLVSIDLSSAIDILPRNTKVVTMRRHPVGLLTSYYDFLRSTFGSEKDLNIMLATKAGTVPFFVKAWSNEWNQLNDWEKAAIAVAESVELQDCALAAMGESKQSQSWVTEFGSLVDNPAEALEEVSEWLEMPLSRKARKASKKLLKNLPSRPRVELRHRQNEEAMDRLKQEVSPQVYEAFVNASKTYSQRSVQRGSLTG